MKKIIVVGSCNTDMVVKTNRIPSPGETLLGGSFFMNVGGKGANQAVAAARLGGSVTFVTKVGNDVFGKQTFEALKKENIDTNYIFIDENAPSGTAIIMVNEEGENCIVVAPGANAKLSASDIDQVKNFSEAEIILTQLEIPLKTIEIFVQMAKANNQKVVLNPAPAQNLNDELLNSLFLITPNESEASLLTGLNVKDELTASVAADIFLSKGVKNVIITLGKQGAYFQNKKLKFKIDAPIVQAIDTTAAGDTFNGALVTAITEEMPWRNAVKFAVKAASLSVTRLGAQSSVPRRDEIVL